MELVNYVGLVAQVLTYASFLSGARVCHSIYKQKSCAKLSPMPFLAGLNSSSLWLRYGFLANESEIVMVNMIGMSFAIIYLTFFVVYSKQKSRLVKQLVGLAVLLATLLYSIHHSIDPMFLAGTLASISSLVACAAPLATIQDVYKTKSTASLPFPIIASSCVVSLSWLAFGYLKGDSFIVFTNVVACTISWAQLSLFAIYPSTSKQMQKKLLSNKKRN